MFQTVERSRKRSGSAWSVPSNGSRRKRSPCSAARLRTSARDRQLVSLPRYRRFAELLMARRRPHGSGGARRDARRDHFSVTTRSPEGSVLQLDVRRQLGRDVRTTALIGAKEDIDRRDTRGEGRARRLGRHIDDESVPPVVARHDAGLENRRGSERGALPDAHIQLERAERGATPRPKDNIDGTVLEERCPALVDSNGEIRRRGRRSGHGEHARDASCEYQHGDRFPHGDAPFVRVVATRQQVVALTLSQRIQDQSWPIGRLSAVLKRRTMVRCLTNCHGKPVPAEDGIDVCRSLSDSTGGTAAFVEP